MVSVSESIRGRVRAGARWLDAGHPDWFRSVNVAWLDMKYGSTCVLGQLYGSYLGCIDAGMLTHAEAVAYGFLAPRIVGIRNPLSWLRQKFAREREWAELRRAWVAEIVARREMAMSRQQPVAA